MGFFFKWNYNFPRFQRGSNIFFRGSGGGVQLFQGWGVQLLIPYRIPYSLCFSGGWGGSGPHAPLWISACNILLWQKLDMRKSYQFWPPPPLGIPTCIHGIWENNHSGLTRIQIVFELFNGSAVVKCLTGDWRATDSILTGVTALRSLSKTHLS